MGIVSWWGDRRSRSYSSWVCASGVHPAATASCRSVGRSEPVSRWNRVKGCCRNRSGPGHSSAGGRGVDAGAAICQSVTPARKLRRTAMAAPPTWASQVPMTSTAVGTSCASSICTASSAGVGPATTRSSLARATLRPPAVADLAAIVPSPAAARSAGVLPATGVILGGWHASETTSRPSTGPGRSTCRCVDGRTWSGS
ncbi:hypothetical protein [Ornithinimicrobium kibberense]|uniref:hypothetical protein n=1 Tax=Ornithinimicrobium kibberense TaxID=282060 RepID=UPI00362174A8